jgi:hypothetical protein
MDFVRRGMSAAGIGPVVLVVMYLILQEAADVYTVSVNQICISIGSLTGLAFICGGMNALYQIERLPLLAAVLIHGSVLYVSYLATYLLNAWLDFGVMPIIVFSTIFVVGYIVIWAIIYSVTKRNTAVLNEILKKKQQKL